LPEKRCPDTPETSFKAATADRHVARLQARTANRHIAIHYADRRGIKGPKRQRYLSRNGVCPKFLRNQRLVQKGCKRVAASNANKTQAKVSTHDVDAHHFVPGFTAKNLSEKQQSAVVHLFRDIDSDNSGFIDKHEWLSEMSASEYSNDNAESFLTIMDKDGDVQISLVEFMKFFDLYGDLDDLSFKVFLEGFNNGQHNPYL